MIVPGPRHGNRCQRGVVVTLIGALALSSNAAVHDAAAQAAQPTAPRCASPGERGTGGLGVYLGNTPEGVAAFERWLGRPVDYVAVHTGRADWRDWSGSIGWASNLWRGIDRCHRWSIPLIADEATLEDAAAGRYNHRYVEAARQLAAARPGDQIILVRTGEEFNGDWMPWASKRRERVFAEAFRQFATSFRSVSPRFRFEWNVNIGDFGTNPEDSYPGDHYVDVVGMDFYYSRRDNPDPGRAWAYMVDRKYGLAWHQHFAKARGKPTAYSEWGIELANAAIYVKNAAAWFRRHDVRYHIYWDSDSEFKGRLSGGQLPATGDAFRAEFGK
jgi:hypothetical protein